MRAAIVLTASIVFAHLAWIIEFTLGIDWNYHPDAVLYVESYHEYVDGLLNIPNNLYFYIASLLAGNRFILIELNIFIYSLTNYLVFNELHKINSKLRNKTKLFYLVALGFLFQPYRLHLSIHVLKDTCIIFLTLVTILFWKKNKIKSSLAALIVSLFRLPSILYFMLFISKRYIVPLILFALPVLYFFNSEIYDFLQSRNDADMGGRLYNEIVNFSESGVWGTFLRAILWPVILMLGLFILFSPALSFVPISLELLFSSYLVYKKNSFEYAFKVMAIMALIAAIVNSFTAYIRYCYPMLCLLPFLNCYLTNEK